MRLLTLLPLVVAFVACAKTESPYLQTPPEKIGSVTVNAGKVSSVPDPKVNILIVVDNSGSMKDYQEKLKNNIAKFAEAFLNNPRIDYKIGVVPVFDRESIPGSKQCKVLSDRRKMNRYAELVPLKNADGTLVGGVPYITRETPDAIEVLKKTVVLGVQCGPEAEESFSPVLGILGKAAVSEQMIYDEAADTVNTEEVTNKGLSEINQGFYDKDATLLVIFLTDADDAQMDGVTFYNKLLKEKGGDRSKILLAAAIPDTTKPGCSVTDALAIEIRKTIREANGVPVNLCSNDFGLVLANFGATAAAQISKQTLHLDFQADTRTKIRYGVKGMREEEMQVIERGAGGFTVEYVVDRRTKKIKTKILLDSNLNIKRLNGGEIFVEAYPIDPSLFKTGRATTAGQ